MRDIRFAGELWASGAGGKIATLALPMSVLLVAACGANVSSSVQQKPSDAPPGQVLNVPKPAAVGAAFTDCESARLLHNNKHNICATFINNSTLFAAPGRLANNLALFTWVSPVDANGTSTHHVNANPADFGDSTFAQTSAQKSYGASMVVKFDFDTANAFPPSTGTKEMGTGKATISTNATQDKDLDNSYSSCNVGGNRYLACVASDPAVVKSGGNYTNNASYNFVNAPLTVKIVNNLKAGNMIISEEGPDTGRMSTSSRGNTTPLDKAATITPGANATWGLYRAVTSETSSFTVDYKVTDNSTLTAPITHNISINAQLVPKSGGQEGSTPPPSGVPVTAWGVDTSATTCADEPSAGAAAYTCSARWTGTGFWTDSAAVTFTVSAGS